MKPRKHFIEYLVSLGHNMAETGPTKHPESIENLRRTEHKKARTKKRKKEIYLDRVERVADYDLGDAGSGSGDVLLGRVSRSGHLKNWRRAQVLECLRRGICRTGGEGERMARSLRNSGAVVWQRMRGGERKERGSTGRDEVLCSCAQRLFSAVTVSQPLVRIQRQSLQN